VRTTIVILAPFAVLAAIGGCAGHVSTTATPASDPPQALSSDDRLTPLQKKKAEMLTSIWENGTTVLQYGYSEDIHDGRGYTSGRAGFCTGTGDAIVVVRCLAAAVGASPLHKYVAALASIDRARVSTGRAQAETSELDAIGSFAADWKRTATDAATAAAFVACQDRVVDELYYEPALRVAKAWGLTSALTKAALYDAEINHGDTGTDALVEGANRATGNAAQKRPAAPITRAAESAWLRAFLTRRLETLRDDATWAEAVDRAALYEKLRQEESFDLKGMIVTDAKASAILPGAGYRDSGYPRCVIAEDGAVSGDSACTK
jgi:chitosanase